MSEKDLSSHTWTEKQQENKNDFSDNPADCEECFELSGKYLFKKNFATGIMLFSVIAACILIYLIFMNISSISAGIAFCIRSIMPVIYGLVIAFILNPIVVFIEEFLFAVFKQENKGISVKAKKRIRLISVLLSVVVAVWCIYILLKMILPQTFDSIYILVQDLPQQSADFSKKVIDFVESQRGYSETVDYAIKQAADFLNDWIENDLLTLLSTMSKNLATGVFGVVNVVYKFVYNIIIGLIVAIYVLLSKENFAGQCKKIIYSALKIKQANILISYIRKSYRIFMKFIIGKIVDSIIIGLLCFGVTSIFSIPYALLISFIIGVTNVIPVFGPFIGAVPSCLLVLIVSPMQAVYLLIIILILQQLDGNIIGPKILGDSIGISAFWILFSILLFGKMWGVVGMIVGVPIFATGYMILKDVCNHVLQKNGLTTDTKQYIKVDHIEYEEVDGAVKAVYYDNHPKKPGVVRRPRLKKITLHGPLGRK